MKSTERFSNRVTNYVKYRPSYPVELINTLAQKCNLSKQSIIADVGSGTGKLTELLLQKGCSVFAVEPNQAMREAAEKLFRDNEKFVSVAGTSETTGLNEKSVDLIVAAQAFHWFEPKATKHEFKRILKPGGCIALIWNRREMASPFQKEYDQMLATYCAEYQTVNHRNISEAELGKFLSPNAYAVFNFPYAQQFDKAGFLGRMYSSSYTPIAGSSEAEALNTAAEQLFDKYQSNGVIEFVYKTNLYLARC